MKKQFIICSLLCAVSAFAEGSEKRDTLTTDSQNQDNIVAFNAQPADSLKLDKFKKSPDLLFDEYRQTPYIPRLQANPEIDPSMPNLYPGNHVDINMPRMIPQVGAGLLNSPSAYPDYNAPLLNNKYQRIK